MSVSDDRRRAASLQGVRVCMLRETDYSIDGRARKQAKALANAAATVTMIGVGDTVPEDLSGLKVDVLLVPKSARPRLVQPRLGREDTWWPVRVAVNLTYTRFRARRMRRTRSWVFPDEDALVAAALRHEPEIVHAHNIQCLGAAVRIKQRTGARVVYDCRDMYTKVDYIDGKTRRSIHAWEAALLHDVDAVITVSDSLGEAIAASQGIRRPVAIYNGPFEVAPEASPVHQPVRLFFQGAFHSHRNLIALLEAMCSLEGRATLTMQGFGGIEEDLHRLVELRGLKETVHFIPPVEPLDVVKSASRYDVGIVCHKGTNLNMQAAVPNKLMDYLGAGLAIAASDLPGHRSVLDGTGAGIFIDPSTAETIAQGLQQLLENPVRITEMKRAALSTAKRYEWAVQAKRLIEVYQSVLGSDATPSGG